MFFAGNDVIRFMGIDRAGFPKLDRFGSIMYPLESDCFLLNEDTINTNPKMMTGVLISSPLEMTPNADTKKQIATCKVEIF